MFPLYLPPYKYILIINSWLVVFKSPISCIHILNSAWGLSLLILCHSTLFLLRNFFYIFPFNVPPHISCSVPFLFLIWMWDYIPFVSLSFSLVKEIAEVGLKSGRRMG
jgi:hypothetical protein